MMTLLRGTLLLLLILALPTAPGQAQTAELALPVLQEQAAAGDVAAQLALAQRYHDGAGTVQNFALAAQWFTPAAEAGNAQAQNRLGRYYHGGLGVQADRATALRWLRLAADQGAAQYMHDLASVLEEATDDPQALTEAAALYERAAAAGHAASAVSLGVMVQNGIGVPRDLARAHALYEPAAAAGHPRAQNNLGLLYVRGDGVPQDYDRAFELFAAAAEQGLAEAITNLGVMYENGFGVPFDEAEAARLYRLGQAASEPAGFVYDPRLAPPPTDDAGLTRVRDAALAGDPVAEFQIAWLLVHKNAPVATDWSDAALMFERAANKGHAPAMANLALLYLQGRGRPQDYVLAQMWLALAGAAGLSDAARITATLQGRMTPDQINEAQALAEVQRQRIQADR